MITFYDTSSLLKELNEAFKESFFISSITLKELENIKTSAHKDSDIKYKARKLIHLINNYENKVTVIHYNKNWDNEINESNLLTDNNDSRIILSALYVAKDNNIVFQTDDLCCKHLAKAMGLNVKSTTDKKEEYKGYKEIVLRSEQELADFYNKLYTNTLDIDLLQNEYLLISNGEEIVDRFIYTNDKLEKVQYNCFNSKMFGKVKPIDYYQILAVDSLERNQITMLRGSAGTGKSYLAMGYLLSLLEKHEIEKIIIFCNTVATAGAARLGFYAGTKTEKLLDSQIGNFLSSKLGGRIAVERMIEENVLELLPMSDIRGYDTTGMKAGIYITEAQNLDIELMRLALQRVGEDSICILDGDFTHQVDMQLYADDNNGMKRASEVFRGQNFYGEVELATIHRSKIAMVAEMM
jgi:predicted ribonuclease YlaK